MAVSSALTVLSWFENLPDEEQPPREIWYSEELLADWFKKVKENRGNKKSSGTKSKALYDRAEDAPMTDNELAAETRRNLGLEVG